MTSFRFDTLLRGNFQPPDIDGLTRWYDAADTSTLTGDPVSAWNDKGSSGVNLAQGTAARRPTRATVNGRNTLSFDGSDDYIQATNGTGLPSGLDTPFTIFVAARQNIGSIAGGTFVTMSNAASGLAYTNAQVLLSTADHMRMNRRDDADSVPDTIFAATADGAAADDGVMHYYTWVFKGNTVTFREDGATLAADLALDKDTCTFTEFTIGGIELLGSFFAAAEGEIGDVLLYDSVLDEAEIQKVERYLRNKWT